MEGGTASCQRLGTLHLFCAYSCVRHKFLRLHHFRRTGELEKRAHCRRVKETLLDQDTADAGITVPFYFRDMDISRRCVVH